MYKRQEPQRRPAVKKFLEDGIVNSCYSVEGNCALHIKNDDEYLSVDFGKEKNAYIVSMDGDKVKEVSFNRLSIRT